MKAPDYFDAARVLEFADRDASNRFDRIALDALDLADRWADAGEEDLDRAALQVYQAATACAEPFQEPRQHERNLAELEGAVARLESLANEHQAALEAAADHRWPF